MHGRRENAHALNTVTQALAWSVGSGKCMRAVRAYRAYISNLKPVGCSQMWRCEPSVNGLFVPKGGAHRELTHTTSLLCVLQLRDLLVYSSGVCHVQQQPVGPTTTGAVHGRRCVVLGGLVNLAIQITSLAVFRVHTELCSRV